MKRMLFLCLCCLPLFAQRPETAPNEDPTDARTDALGGDPGTRASGTPGGGRPAPRPWSGGLFMTTDSQPYRDADGIVRVFPFVSYRSRNVEWYGPFIRYRFAEAGGWSFFARGQVDFGAYDEDDSDILRGLGDRSTTVLLGAGVGYELSRRWRVHLSADRDVLGAHDGTEAVWGVTRSFGSPFAPFSGSLSAGARFQDKDWTRDRVGVPAERAREGRAAYSPEESLHPYVSMRAMYRFTDRWLASLGLRYEWLDDSWRDSPLVEDRGRFTTIATLSYAF